MSEHYHTICLIPAGGTGIRVGGDVPKQYLPLQGRPIIRHAVEAFLNHKAIDAVCVIRRKDDHNLYHDALGDLPLLPPVDGGDTRQASIYNGLRALQHYTPKKILIHDAARPFISDTLITNVIDALDTHDAVLPTIALEDTVKHCEDGYSIKTLDRSTLYRAQTPQGFTYEKILQCHSNTGENVTDDASLFEALGLPVHTVEGHRDNYKITTVEDVKRAQQQRGVTSIVRTGFGYDVHAFDTAEATHLRIGGVDIPHTRRLKGHSDADVLLHALVDAMLGSVAEGDIGDHFPPSDPTFKGMDSTLFVQKAHQLLMRHHAIIHNIDLLIIAEAPKISPHKQAIKERITSMLALSNDQVNIKATTTEKLGFTGRKEGIAAQATITISIEG